MASKSKRARSVKQRNLPKEFAYWALAIFIVKLIVISNIQGGAWFAADGENYIKGVNSLFSEGIFAKQRELTYWPAGYPIFIYSLKIFGSAWLLTTLSIMQSAIFSFATYYFAKSLLVTRVRSYAYFILLVILLNPTLSLSSMSVGYESLASSGYLLSLGMIIVNLHSKDPTEFKKFIVCISLIIGFLGFIQPRLLLGGLVLLSIWIFISKPRKSILVYLLISAILVLILPGSLVVRNDKAVGIKSISTNLGVTMDIGAGDGATGGYDSKVRGVDCKLGNLNEAEADRERIKCVLEWYVTNPTQSLKLFWNKSIYFWSPWSGPLLSGTMGLNPWLKINPIVDIAKTPDGSKLVAGGIGRVIAILWISSSLLFMLYGLFTLWRLGKLERVVGTLAFGVVASSWAITLVSIGDHRFRLPIMGMSLFLQVVGIRTLFRGGKPPMVDGPALR
jgi:hypothetical protein